MAHSLVKNYVHIVYSTKHRQKLIKPPFEKDLYGYLGQTCNNLGCNTIIAGGHLDHVHILCLLSKNIALAKLLQKVKANSSRWMKTQDESLKNFAWQNGYGSFSVNPRKVDIVANYIRNQHEHHKKKTFKQEYRAYLEKYDMEYDERYVWD